MEETISEKEFIQIQLDAKNGNPEALSDLGYIYEEGIIVEQDYEKAKEYYEQAAKKGDVNSLISGLSDKDKQLLSRLMEDKTARENFLSSDEAKRIISELMNGR